MNITLLGLLYCIIVLFSFLIIYVVILLTELAMDGYRPNPGETPVPGLWYNHDLEYGQNSSLNIFFYGMHLDGVTPDRSYSADALSANR